MCESNTQPLQQETESEQVDLQSTADTEQEETLAPVEQTKKNIFGIIVAVSCMVLQSVVILVMLFGATNVFGRSVSLLTAFQFILEFFSITQGVIFRSIASIAVAVVYAIFFVLYVRNLVRSCKLLSKYLKQKETSVLRNNLGSLYFLTQNSFLKFILFIILCYMLSNDSIHAGTYLVLVSGGILFILTHITVLWDEVKDSGLKNNITLLTFSALRLIFFVIVIPFLAKYIIQPAFYNLSFGLQIIFGGHFGSGVIGIISTLYEYLVKDILNVVVVFFFYALLSDVLEENIFINNIRPKTNTAVTKRSTILLIITGISAGISILLTALKTGISTVNSSTLASWFSLLRIDFLPVLILLIAIILTTKGVFEIKETLPIKK